MTPPFVIAPTPEGAAASSTSAWVPTTRPASAGTRGIARVKFTELPGCARSRSAGAIQRRHCGMPIARRTAPRGHARCRRQARDRTGLVERNACAMSARPRQLRTTTTGRRKPTPSSIERPQMRSSGTRKSALRTACDTRPAFCNVSQPTAELAWSRSSWNGGATSTPAARFSGMGSRAQRPAAAQLHVDIRCGTFRPWPRNGS